MTGRLGRGTVAAIALATALGPVAGHTEAAPMTEIDRVAFDGGVWVSHRLNLPDGAQLSYWASGYGDSVVLTMSVWLSGPTGGMGGTVFSVGDDVGIARLETQDPYPASVEFRPTGVFGGQREIGFDDEWLQGGIYDLLIFVAGDSAFEGDLVISASDGSESLRRTQGDDVFFYRDQDFAGGTNISLMAAGRGPRFVRGSSVEETIEHRLFGSFASLSDDARLSVQGPGGYPVAEWWWLFEGAPAGDYRFTIDEMGPHLSSTSSGAWLVGADVDLAWDTP